MGAYSAETNPATSAQQDDTSAGRSFFSRFALPIRSRTRNLADFHIRPADPHRKYAAGDHVRGAVILTILKPIRITHLTVSLHGYVRVFKRPNAAAHETAVNPLENQVHGSSRFKFLGNGFASLFQDEQVLSADGRLEAGKYEFNFDLMFPSKGLPSSIDFERGTISYLITATLTRPTTIAPVTSCDRKIYLVEKVDIGQINPPRARTIYLEPIPKKARKRRPAPLERGASTTSEPPADVASDFDSTRANDQSTEGSLFVVGEDMGDPPPNPRSPVHSDHRSEVSGESGVSGSTGHSKSGDHGGARDSVTHQAGNSRQLVVEDRTITATIEMLKGGCLPGDMISVKISVQHIKRIKSMHGVIVTLYRQGRIDSSPATSAVKGLSREEYKQMEKEEFYPKSKTGLGGLSLSSAGSCSVFRKDLSQAFSPLIIDPVTLTASVTATVRVPEDAFPTIKGIPGEMITFRYQLEIIVDLGGKLASQIQSGQGSTPRVGTVGGPGVPGIPVASNPYDGGATSLASWGGSLIDTDRLRREKGVISVLFEVVVGTLDSARQRGKGIAKPAPLANAPHTHDTNLPNGGGKEKGKWPNGFHDEGYAPQEYQRGYESYPGGADEQYPHRDTADRQTAAPIYVPPPEVPNEAQMTEKERMRQAERRLLPSQPIEPTTAGPSAPSAVADGENIYDAEDEPAQGAAGPSQLPGHADTSNSSTSHDPTAPTIEDLSATAGATDDKRELERQRLLAEASAPPDFPDDYDGDATAGPSSSSAAVPSAPSAPSFEPSAPMLDESGEEGAYGPQYSFAGPSGDRTGPSQGPAEPLPKYER